MQLFTYISYTDQLPVETHYMDPVDNKSSLDLWGKLTEPAFLDLKVCIIKCLFI